MKIKVFPTIIAAAISLLIAYGLHSYCKTEGKELLLAIGGFICLFLPLATCIGVRFETRTTANTAVVGGIFFLALLVSNIIFVVVEFVTPPYVIVNGLLVLLMIAIVYGLAKTKQ